MEEKNAILVKMCFVSETPELRLHIAKVKMILNYSMVLILKHRHRFASNGKLIGLVFIPSVVLFPVGS